MKVDHISLATTPIYLSKGNTFLGLGTGFFYSQQHDAEHKVSYLITNYHVLTGSSPVENKLPIGDNISFQFHLSETETGIIKPVRYPLFTKSGKPMWLTNSNYPGADLAVIPIPAPLWKDCKPYSISAQWAQTSIKVSPSSNVTLIGYPYGFHDVKNALPIWKTGSVASEPDIDFNGMPLFLIDISAFPGMSGSPAFAIPQGGTFMLEDGGAAVGNARKFLGIYASMQMIDKEKYVEIIQSTKLSITNQESLEIGSVWKAKLILETVASIDVGKYQEEILKNLQGF